MSAMEDPTEFLLSSSFDYSLLPFITKQKRLAPSIIMRGGGEKFRKTDLIKV